MSYSTDRRKAAAAPTNPVAQHNDSASIVDQRASTAAHLQLKQKIDNSQSPGASQATAQLAADKPNNTGLPDNLKAGIENLSGMSMDHVKVHYNSAQPAQLNAHAYAQGSDIHVAPGQERHLPHEAWHVVQQAQGRVRPTVQMKAATAINDDAGLEQEADLMGTRAMQLKRPVEQPTNALHKSIGREKPVVAVTSGPMQLTKRSVRMTWLTHLVREESGSILDGNEVPPPHGQMEPEDALTIDDAISIQSRRGPHAFENSEQYRAAEKKYTWYNVTGIRGEQPASADYYVRDGTFKLVPAYNHADSLIRFFTAHETPEAIPHIDAVLDRPDPYAMVFAIGTALKWQTEEIKKIARAAIAYIGGEHAEAAGDTAQSNQAFVKHLSSVLTFGVLPRTELIKRGLVFQPSEDTSDTSNTSFGSVLGGAPSHSAKEILHGVATERNVEGNHIQILREMAREQGVAEKFAQHEQAIASAPSGLPQKLTTAVMAAKIAEQMGEDDPLVKTLRQRLNDAALIVSDRHPRALAKGFPALSREELHGPRDGQAFAEVRGKNWLFPTDIQHVVIPARHAGALEVLQARFPLVRFIVAEQSELTVSYQLFRTLAKVPVTDAPDLVGAAYAHILQNGTEYVLHITGI